MTPVSVTPIDFVEGWRILRIAAKFKGCAMMASYEGSQQIGFRFPAADARQVEMISAKPGWDAIQAGREYSVSVEIRGSKFNALAFGYESNGSKTLRMTIPREAFDQVFNYSTVKFLRVSYNGALLVSLVPTNRDFEAMIAINRCLKTFDDPFAK